MLNNDLHDGIDDLAGMHVDANLVADVEFALSFGLLFARHLFIHRLIRATGLEPTMLA